MREVGVSGRWGVILSREVGDLRKGGANDGVCVCVCVCVSSLRAGAVHKEEMNRRGLLVNEEKLE